MNKYLEPLEEFLPTGLANAAAKGDQETTPLLRSAGEAEAQQTESQIQRLGQRARVPPTVARHIFNPLARFFEPHIFASYQAMKSWIEDEHGDYEAILEDTPEYTEEDLKKAYLNPALTSLTPPIWLAKDEFNVSTIEIRENEEDGLKSSDRGAWLLRNGNVRWKGEDFRDVPIWKEKVRY